MGFCPFGNNQEKTNINNACVVTCALYDSKTRQCSIKLIAASLKKLALSSDKESVKN